jgi:Na+/pantothenate symporter
MGRKLLLAAISGAWVLAMTVTWVWLGVACNLEGPAAGWYWALSWMPLAVIIAIPFVVYNDTDSNNKETPLEEIYG